MTRSIARVEAAEATSGGDGAGPGAGEVFAFSGPDAGARFLLGLLLCGGGVFPVRRDGERSRVRYPVAAARDPEGPRWTPT